MNDNRTDAEKYQAWVHAVLAAWELGWRCEREWIFVSPSGTRHDLSAADLQQLPRIERKGLFIANDLLDADGSELVRGRIYKIASAPECTNRFRCVALHDPNGTMFVREHDNMVHLGREFIEYRAGVRYYNVSDTYNEPSSQVACSACRGTGQDDPPPGKYHGICPVCKGSGKKPNDQADPQKRSEV